MVKSSIYLTKTLKGGLHGLFGSTKLSGKGAKSKGIVLGLDTMRHLMAKLNNPQDKVKFIQVAGTNGRDQQLPISLPIFIRAELK